MAVVLAAICVAGPVLAGDIAVSDAYARAAMPGAKSGAVFMVIENDGDSDDRLVAARTDVAMRVELHTHRQDANGVMQMVEIEGVTITERVDLRRVNSWRAG